MFFQASQFLFQVDQILFQKGSIFEQIECFKSAQKYFEQNWAYVKKIEFIETC